MLKGGGVAMAKSGQRQESRPMPDKLLFAWIIYIHTYIHTYINTYIHTKYLKAFYMAYNLMMCLVDTQN